MRVVTPNEMSQLDQLTIKEGIPAQKLMELAGIESFKIIKENIKKKDKILVICGSGNNGGDGQVIARLLKEDNYSVKVLFTTDKENLEGKMSKESFSNYELLKNFNIPIIYGTDFKEIKKLIKKSNVIVDCIFGTGLTNRPMNDYYSKLIKLINKSDSYKIAIDIPSGLNGTSGTFDKTVRADLTIAIQCLKTGEILEDGPDVTGKIEIVDIGINDQIIVKGIELKNTINPDLLQFPIERLNNSYKYDYGRVLILAGSKGLLGAASLAARGALKTGAGLVTNLIPYNLYDPLVSISSIEALVRPFEIQPNFKSLQNYKFDVFLMGPGLGFDMDYTDLLIQLLEEDTKLVIDADGIRFLKEALKEVTEIKADVIITPHQGEFANLISKTVNEVKNNALDLVLDFAKQNKMTVVLKGFNTLIISKDGQVCINTTGNPGMATPGSGDVLSGMVASIFGQLDNSFESAKAAVYYHGLSGDYYSHRYGETTLTAMDLIKNLKYVL